MEKACGASQDTGVCKPSREGLRGNQACLTLTSGPSLRGPGRHICWLTHPSLCYDSSRDRYQLQPQPHALCPHGSLASTRDVTQVESICHQGQALGADFGEEDTLCQQSPLVWV